MKIALSSLPIVRFEIEPLKGLGFPRQPKAIISQIPQDDNGEPACPHRNGQVLSHEGPAQNNSEHMAESDQPKKHPGDQQEYTVLLTFKFPSARNESHHAAFGMNMFTVALEAAITAVRIGRPFFVTL